MIAKTQAALEDDIGVSSTFTVLGNFALTRAGLEKRMASWDTGLSNPEIVSSNKPVSDKFPIGFLNLDVYIDDGLGNEVGNGSTANMFNGDDWKVGENEL
jgi:hypothetical protein